ncbi:MAG: hypothetical protein K1X94_31075 [Sandaracinaceae bacterium]|nr:hypothetical protein [Sandaracinaceae bacterium]
MHRAFGWALVVCVGCASTSPAAPPDGASFDAGDHDGGVLADTAPDLGTLLGAAGLDVAPGSLESLDLTGCCDPGRSCAGNNPSSPYLTVFVPRGPGQTEPSTGERADGRAAQFRLRADEAIVIVGTTPPPAAYFGLTPYLMSRQDPGATRRREPFASLGETLNDEVIEVNGASAFGVPFAAIATGDATTDRTIRGVLETLGLRANTVTFDPSVVRFGLEDGADEVGLLFRYALPDDAAAGAAWVESPGATVLRVTPRTSHADALPAPSARAKGTTVEEASLTAALDRLEAAVRAAHSSRTIRDLTVTDEPPDPTACIAGTAVCAGDNRDTVYPRTPPFVLGRTDDVYVLGVDHTVTHHATYANASVYSVEHLAGLVSVTSRTWSGSASEWLPGDPDASSLFVWRISRDCGTDAHCLAVPTTECPTGASYATLLDIAFRAYLEPGTGTGPSPSTLILERALLVQGP